MNKKKKWKQLKKLCIDNLIKHNFRPGINKVKNFLETCQSNSVKLTTEMSVFSGGKNNPHIKVNVHIFVVSLEGMAGINCED